MDSREEEYGVFVSGGVGPNVQARWWREARRRRFEKKGNVYKEERKVR